MSRWQRISAPPWLGVLLLGLTVLLALWAIAALVRALWPLLQLAVLLTIAVWLWQRFRAPQRQQAAALQRTFYRLLQQNQGCLTVLELAIATPCPPQVAQHFLDARAKELHAQFDVTDTGQVYYIFAVGRSPVPPG